MNTEIVATMSVQEHYSALMSAYQNEQWEELVRHGVIIVKNFPSTPFSEEALFFLGVGHFQLQDYELANRHLTRYLKMQATPKYFEEAIQYKFRIAERFQGGAKKHIFGIKSMPKWVPAREEALAIYDEVITALPHHDLAAQALFGKAQLLLKEDEYKACIETYQTLIRRFPKHPLAGESYIGIGQVYLVQSQEQYPDQDFLDLAEINLRKFKMDFPGEEKAAAAEKMLQEMKEIYASNLYDTGRFYERTKKPHAAFIYYTRILAKYPDTNVADLANKRLSKLNYKPPQGQSAPAEQATPPASSSSPLLNLQVQGQVVQNELPSQNEALK